MGLVMHPRRAVSWPCVAMFACAAGLAGGALVASMAPGLIPLAKAALAAEESVPSLTRKAEGLSNMVLGERSVDYFQAQPEGETGWPGIVLLHDGWGMRDEVKAIARRLAEEGFVVVVPDLNGGRIAKTADKAREISILMDKAAAVSIASAVGEHMKQQSYTGDHRVGIVGIDSGGYLALRASMETSAFSAVVTIYGKPIEDADELRRIGAPLLGVFAGADKLIPVADVERFSAALQAGNRTAEIRIYENAAHGFMDEGSESHDKSAASDAWSLIASFLRAHL